MNKRFHHWVKLQRKYRNLQLRWAHTGELKLQRKLEAVANRITRLNKKWRIGIATTLLTAWLAWAPGSAQAQGPVRPLKFNLPELQATDGFAIAGGGGNYTTHTVEIVGDLNGDGLKDFVIGEYYNRFFYSYYGSYSITRSDVYVVFGKSSGFVTPPDLTNLTPTEGFEIAVTNQINSIANAGDVNNDGIEDLIMGSVYADDKKGHVYVIFGSETIANLDVADLDGTNGFTITGIGGESTGGNFSIGDQIGNSVSGNGDVNNDGIDDLAFGGYKFLGFRGSSFVVFGKDTWPATMTTDDVDGSVGFKVFGTINNSVRSGRSVDISGDFDGDGIEDLLIGESSAFYGASRRGTVFIMLGKETGLNGVINIGQATHYIRPSATNVQFRDRLSEHMTYIPDFNGDGINDVLIAAPTENDRSNAYVVVLFGGLQGTGSFNIDNLDGTNGFVIRHSGQEGIASAVTTGDFNTDGLSDVVIGSYNGPSYLVFGSSDPMASLVDLNDLSAGEGSIFTGTNFSSESVSLKGDITGDGLDDFLITDKNSGDTFVLFGKSAPEFPTVVNPFPTQTVVEEQLFDYALPAGIFASQDPTLTFSVARDNDGPLPAWLSFDPASNTLSGTPKNGDEGTLILKVTATDTQQNAASALLTVVVVDEKAFISGSSLEDLSQQVIQINANVGYSDFATSVSGTGDINGDGIDEVLLSAPRENVGAYNRAGAAYLLFGNSNGLSSPFELSTIDGSNGAQIAGFNAYQNVGQSISNAGDVNGDGREDFIVSDNNDSYVIFGSNVIPHPFDLNSLDGTNGFKVHHSYNDISGNLKPIGDFNGDGLDDLITGTGYPYTSILILGSSSSNATLDLDAGEPGRTFSLQAYGMGQVSGIGDVNGDGLDDIAMAVAYSEKSYVFFGTDQLTASVNLDNISLDGTDGFTFNLQPQTYYGYYNVAVDITGAGDLNGDGIDDFLVNGQDGIGDDGMIVVFGNNQGFPAVMNPADINGENGFWFVSKSYGLGSVVTTGADFNNDGFDDLVVGDYNRIWVLFSKQESFNEILSTSDFTVQDGFYLDLGNYYAQTVSVTDFNGDGVDDIIFGDHYSERAFLILGDGPKAPVVANSVADVNLNEDQPLSLTIPGTTFSDPNPNDELTLSITYQGTGAVPAWVTINQGNASLSGIPLTDADAGTFPFRVTATDEDGLNAFVDFNVQVTAVNDAPIIDAIGDKTTNANTLLTFLVSAQDEESTALEYSLDSESTGKGMTIDLSTGSFSWTPSQGQSGTHDATITVSDGVLTASETITITVNATNTAPVLATIGNQVVDATKQLTFTATATDADLPTNTLTFSLDQTSVDKGMTINGATGVFTWTTALANEGTHETTISVSDGSLSDSETITIAVIGPLGLTPEKQLTVSPNPVRDYLTVKSAEKLKMEIVGMDGRVYKTGVSDELIDVRDLSQGVYLIRLVNNQGEQSIYRIVKH